jgi:hypothetical protein
MPSKQSDLDSYIIYEKMTGRMVHISARNHNDAALVAIKSFPARHNDIRKVEVIKVDDMTTIKIKVHQPELLDE